MPLSNVPYHRSVRSRYVSSHAGGPLLPACRREPRPSSRGRSHRNRPSNFRVSRVPSSLFSLLRLRDPQPYAVIGFEGPVFSHQPAPPATTHPRPPLQRGECRPRPTPLCVPAFEGTTELPPAPSKVLIFAGTTEATVDVPQSSLLSLLPPRRIPDLRCNEVSAAHAPHPSGFPPSRERRNCRPRPLVFSPSRERRNCRPRPTPLWVPAFAGTTELPSTPHAPLGSRTPRRIRDLRGNDVGDAPLFSFLFPHSSLLTPSPPPSHPNPRRSPLGDQVTQRPHQSIHPVWRR